MPDVVTVFPDIPVPFVKYRYMPQPAVPVVVMLLFTTLFAVELNRKAPCAEVPLVNTILLASVLFLEARTYIGTPPPLVVTLLPITSVSLAYCNRKIPTPPSPYVTTVLFAIVLP